MMGERRDSQCDGRKERFPLSWVGRGIPNMIGVKRYSQYDEWGEGLPI